MLDGCFENNISCAVLPEWTLNNTGLVRSVVIVPGFIEHKRSYWNNTSKSYTFGTLSRKCLKIRWIVSKVRFTDDIILIEFLRLKLKYYSTMGARHPQLNSEAASSDVTKLRLHSPSPTLSITWVPTWVLYHRVLDRNVFRPESR